MEIRFTIEGYAISNEKYKRHCEILKQVIEEIEWNNSVLRMETNYER